MRSPLKQLREFVLQGNLVDLAVAVVLGTAFGAVVTALVADVLTPLIAASGGLLAFLAVSLAGGQALRVVHVGGGTGRRRALSPRARCGCVGCE